MKHTLLCKSHELETARMEAEEEISKDKLSIQQLLQLLEIAFRERDEARDQLQRLQNKFQPTIQAETSPTFLQVLPESPIPTKFTETNTMQIESDSNFKACNYNSNYSNSTPVNHHLVGSGFYSDFSSYPSMVDRASVVIDSLVKGKPLPQKGKLLQTVLEAGPLLQTLLIPPLPQWRNPPPLHDSREVQANPIHKKAKGTIQNSSHLVISHGSTGIPSTSILHIPCNSRSGINNGHNLHLCLDSDRMHYGLPMGKRRRLLYD